MKLRLIGLFLLFTGFEKTIFAKKNVNTDLISCGSAKVVEFKSCENAKVELDFSGCKVELSKQQASKTICEGETLKASLATETQYSEAKFEKVKDSWGAIQWQLKDKLRQRIFVNAEPQIVKTSKNTQLNETKKRLVTTKHNEILPELKESKAREENRLPTAIVPNLVPKILDVPIMDAKVNPNTNTNTNTNTEPNSNNNPSSNTPTVKESTKDGIVFGGFLDFRLNSVSFKNQPTMDGNSESGYSIDDGRIAMVSTHGSTELNFDLPFRRAKNADYNPSITPPDYGSNNSNFLFGTDKLQLFGKYRFSDTLVGWAGQFDTPYGVEFNDSKDRIFSRSGLLFNEMLPLTHAGLLLEKTIENNIIRVFSANSNNKGSLGNSSTGDNNFEYGFTWSFANSNYRFQIGNLVRPILASNSNVLKLRNLYDLTFGGTFGYLSLDFELTKLSDPSKNILTADPMDSEKDGIGFLSLITLNPWEKVSTSFRFEKLDNAASGLSADRVKINTIGVNTKWKISDNLEGRAEIINENYETLSSSKWSIQRALISSVLSF